MTTSDRCLCDHLMPSLRSRCSEHGDPDAFLASGHYTDRRGRQWHLCMHGSPLCGMWHQGHPSRGVTRAEMRTLIERDLHRDECPGLRYCANHPVPHVIHWRGSRHYAAYNVPGDREEAAYTLAEALDAARHMAGEQ